MLLQWEGEERVGNVNARKATKENFCAKSLKAEGVISVVKVVKFIGYKCLNHLEFQDVFPKLETEVEGDIY